MLAFGSVRSVGSAWSDSNEAIGARNSETSIVEAEMAQRARRFMEITSRLYFRRGRIDVIEIISCGDSDDDPLRIDAVQCRLVDRARQTQLYPRGQLHLDVKLTAANSMQPANQRGRRSVPPAG